MPRTGRCARARDERGPLDLEIPERKIMLKSDGTVDRVIMPQRLESHRLIEEFMILANVAAAETCERARVPLVYRVHDEPAAEKVNALREFLATLDISLPKGGTLRPDAFNRILARVKGRDVERLVNEVVLRTQAQAEYSPENFGHFGLALRRYAHFTSPIRRYADLIVHRALIRALKLGPDGLAEGTDTGALAEIAASISAAERRAMKAERETADRLIAHFLADRIGAIFDGHISGVTRAGLFVELDETGADGFVPARTIGDEYFRYQRGEPRLRRCFGDLSARRRGDGRAGRGGAGRRGLAVQAAARRSRRGARGWTSIAAAADNRAPVGAARTARQDLMSDDIESAVPGGRLIDPNEADRGPRGDETYPYLRPQGLGHAHSHRPFRAGAEGAARAPAQPAQIRARKIRLSRRPGRDQRPQNAVSRRLCMSGTPRVCCTSSSGRARPRLSPLPWPPCAKPTKRPA